MTPLQCYLDLYRDVEMDRPATGDWSADPDQLPYMIKTRNLNRSALVGAPGAELELARHAFYATITHIDHQIRMVVEALREEGILDDTRPRTHGRRVRTLDRDAPSTRCRPRFPWCWSR